MKLATWVLFIRFLAAEDTDGLMKLSEPQLDLAISHIETLVSYLPPDIIRKAVQQQDPVSLAVDSLPYSSQVAVIAAGMAYVVGQEGLITSPPRLGSGGERNRADMLLLENLKIAGDQIRATLTNPQFLNNKIPISYLHAARLLLGSLSPRFQTTLMDKLALNQRDAHGFSALLESQKIDESLESGALLLVRLRQELLMSELSRTSTTTISLARRRMELQDKNLKRIEESLSHTLKLPLQFITDLRHII